MRRAVFAVSAIALVFLVFGRRADAGTGVVLDPTGDVFNQQSQTSGSGPLDIVSVRHSDDGVRATYLIETKDGFRDADARVVSIGMNGLDGIEQYDCQQLAAAVEPSTGARTGRINQCRGSGGGMEGGPGGTRDLGSVVYEHADGSNVFELSFAIADLRNGGFTGESYGYSVWVDATKDRGSDSMPNADDARYANGYVPHLLSAAPSPTVEPTPAVTPAPTPVPTPVNTPTVQVVASNPPQSTASDVSYAAPEQRDEESGFPVVPVAVGGSVFLAGFSLALVRFLPF